MHISVESKIGSSDARSDALMRQGTSTCTASVSAHRIFATIHTGRTSARYFALKTRSLGSSKLEVRKSQSSKRQAKDPSKYGSMDDMRAHLEQQRKGFGGLAGLLNWLSNSAFGSRLCSTISDVPVATS